MEEILDKIQELYDDNWASVKDHMIQLEKTVGKNPVGSTRRVLENQEITKRLGQPLNNEQQEAFITVLNSLYGEHVVETFKRRSVQYFSRLDKLLERYPKEDIPLETLTKWKNTVKGLLRDLGAFNETSLISTQIEHFARSTLELTKFATTWLDPELFTALYILDMKDKVSRGGTQQVQEYLRGRARRELETLINPKSRNFFSEITDDEANVWWGVFTLFRLELDEFRIHDFKGLSGLSNIVDRLLARKRLTFPKDEVARREITFEVQTEQKTVILINNAGFLLADILDDNGEAAQASRIRDYVLNLQKPFLFGDKLRQNEHLYFICWELEVWSRILGWRRGDGMLDYQGRKLPAGTYRVQALKLSH